MKERFIIMSSESVLAIPEGRKTQTRRVIKNWPPRIRLPNAVRGDWPMYHRFVAEPGIYQPQSNPFGALSLNIGGQWLGIKPDEFEWICPYGQSGDHLWVKETWGINLVGFERGPIPKTHPVDPVTGELAEIIYRADGEIHQQFDPESDTSWSWRPSIFMPRWASRITLEIISRKPERLQDITWEDCLAEGIASYTGAKGVLSENPPDRRWKFIELWDSLNAKRGYPWIDNWWVWRIEFKYIKPGGRAGGGRVTTPCAPDILNIES